MRPYEILCDSNFDMNHELRVRFNLCDDFVDGDIVYPDGHRENCDPEWKNYDQHTFFSMMNNKKNVFKTSVKGIESFISVVEKHLALGEDLLVVSLAAGMSATYSLFNMAKEQLLPKYPERKMEVVDSGRYSIAQGLMAVVAARNRDEKGMSIEENKKWLEENKSTFHQMGPLDDLFFLSRSGRISFGKAFFGSMIGIKPMGDFNHKGTTAILGKAKGLNNAFKADIEYIKRTIVNSEDQIIFVAHSDRPKEAEKYAQMIRDNIPCKEVIVTLIGQGCGVNAGPGLISAYYQGTPISVDNVEETKIMNEILENL